MKKQSFIKGAAVMMCSAVFVKILGAFFKIPLSGILGGTGMGYFMGAYGLFNPVYAVTAAGLPAAVTSYLSRQVSIGGEKKAKEIFSACFYLFSFFGFIISILFWLFSKQMCSIIGNDGAFLAVRAISPCIFLCCVNGALRGYFEGSRQMTPTAWSQVAEVTAKLFLGLFLADLAFKRGLTEFFKYKTVFGESISNIA
ncbi:MAG: oligosaccharide flippase family protein, partial [Oscillospiraceae bacterium]